jgi:hypothetical protein
MAPACSLPVLEELQRSRRKGTENTQLSQNKHRKPINLEEIAKTRRK